ncbi:MAG: penicillin-binding transpeptidase domain-containing protein, partial [Candidatus Limnocylindrales bacterium]
MSRGTAPRLERGIARMALVVIACYGLVALGVGYWQGLRAQALTDDPGNPLIASLRAGPRGEILDARGTVLAQDATVGGVRVRRYPQPAAEPAVGYWSPSLGAAGLELSYDHELAGLTGASPVDALLRKFGAPAGTPLNVVTSLDMRLQADAVRLLGAQKGAIVAIEPSTGRVLALASSPTFDPNKVVAPATGAAYMAGLSAAGNAAPLLDRVTQGLYTPGSVFKMVTAIAGLGSGTITADTTYADQPGEEATGFLVDGYRVVDGHHPFTGTTAVDLIQATEVSCNIYFAHVGLATGGAQLRDWARRLGFEAPIPFDLPTAISQVTAGTGPGDGFVDDVELANASYGQGTTYVTPLQMALVAATIGDGGTLMQPTIVDSVQTPDGTVVQRQSPQVWRQVLPTAEAQVLRVAMTGAVESAWGKPFAGSAAIP